MVSPRELRESYRYCGRVAKREARNFYYAFWLLPPARRRAMCALYAFMRRTDDLADEPGPADSKRRALETWKAELDDALAGRSGRRPELPALADAVAAYAIPAHLLHEVIKGVSMDLAPKNFESFDQLTDYCYHVASVVGLCCIHVWGYRSESGKAERLAVACGIALQLTNILRDVREDARNGRIYLPLEDLDRFSATPEELIVDQPSRRVRELFAFEAERAYSYYDQAQGLIPLVDPVGRPVLKTIMRIYRSLLDEIVRREYDVLGGRVSISGWKKGAIALRALLEQWTWRPWRAAAVGLSDGPKAGA